MNGWLCKLRYSVLATWSANGVLAIPIRVTNDRHNTSFYSGRHSYLARAAVLGLRACESILIIKYFLSAASSPNEACPTRRTVETALQPWANWELQGMPA